MRSIADTLVSLRSLYRELRYMDVCATPQIVLNAMVSRSYVQEAHLLSMIGSDQREVS